MLNIGDTERQMLRASCALSLDESANEVLSGLTLEESKFVLFVDSTGKDELGPTERERYLALMIRHRSARILLSTRKVRSGALSKPAFFPPDI